MKKIFIIPGFKQSTQDDQYSWMHTYFKKKGLVVQESNIHWDHKVMTDYVEEFSAYYTQHKGEKNYVLGFSFEDIHNETTFFFNNKSGSWMSAVYNHLADVHVLGRCGILIDGLCTKVNCICVLFCVFCWFHIIQSPCSAPNTELCTLVFATETVPYH